MNTITVDNIVLKGSEEPVEGSVSFYYTPKDKRDPMSDEHLDIRSVIVGGVERIKDVENLEDLEYDISSMAKDNKRIEEYDESVRTLRNLLIERANKFLDK